MLRRLETGDPVDMLEAVFGERRERDDRPWVMLNMVASIDGATAVGGGASGLNDADDRALFLSLRAVADVVMMGAQTVRSEGLGPIRMTDEMMAYREMDGLDGEPRMVILTQSLAIEPEHRMFSDQTRRPIVLTGVDADPDRVDTLAAVSDVVQVEALDGAGIVDALSDASVILCEGGPTVNSELLRAGVVDELHLTISPMIAMGESKRLAGSGVFDPPIGMTLDRVFVGDRSLFLRYLR